MEHRIIIRIIINITIIFTLLISCSSPLEIDADRGEKQIIGEKNDIFLSRDTLDFGFVHPNKSKTLSFSIKNLTSNQYSIDYLTINHYNNLFSLFNFNQSILSGKNSNDDEAEFFVAFTADSEYNHYIDSIYINDLKNPDLKLIATIPAVFGDDLDFDEVKIGNIGSRFLYINNISDKNITLTDILISNNSFILKGLDSNTLEIKAHETVELIVTFEPLLLSTYTAYLTFNFNYFPYPVDNTINLSGIAVK